MAAPAVLSGYGAFIERTRYRVRETDLPIPGLHPDLEGLRIAQISDLHVSPYLSVREAGRVVDMTNELRPQLTLVTGDLISSFGDPLDATIAEVGRLRADAGVLGCLGNHEAYAECEDYTTMQARRYGIVFLRQEARRLQWGKGVLNVAGVDFQSFRRRNIYLRDAGELIVPGVSNLLLSHNPDVFPVAVRQGYDAVVSGHTHGGQVTVEILNQTLNLARFYTPYVAGLYRIDGRSCYVTAGIGTIGMPVRVGAPPEITLLRLRRA
jgi:predicted MPP superfamily phosphohydrolase